MKKLGTRFLRLEEREKFAASLRLVAEQIGGSKMACCRTCASWEHEQKSEEIENHCVSPIWRGLGRYPLTEWDFYCAAWLEVPK